jgi:phosphoribosylaminoimidazole-succinocarboxamide synthase
MQNAQVLAEPIFTPAAKAEMGQHDENISYAEVEKRIGSELAKKIRETSIRLYREAAQYALEKGIIIADTKFEFGLDEKGQLVLMDEILTADSSRFWPAATYQVGANPLSFDKQFLRDWLESVRVDGKPWEKTPPAPHLPPEIINKTAEKYRDALHRLTQ